MGGRDDRLTRATSAYLDPSDLDTRESDVAQMVRAAARAIATLPPPQSSEAAQQRLAMSRELTGAEKRSAVERARYQAARAHWQTVSTSWRGRLALWLGLVR